VAAAEPPSSTDLRTTVYGPVAAESRGSGSAQRWFSDFGEEPQVDTEGVDRSVAGKPEPAELETR
jgi:hypothetical protein